MTAPRAALLLAAIAAWSPPAIADRAAGASVPAGAAWLDEDAPVVVSIRPGALPAAATLFERAYSTDVPEAAAGLEIARAKSNEVLGVDLLGANGWRDAGFDPTDPVVISIAAIDDRAAERVYERLFDLSDWSDAALRKVPKTYWRSRAVLRIADEKRAARTVRALADAAPELFVVGKQDAKEIAMLLGGSARKSEQIVERLRKRKLVAIGWLPGVDSVISFRIDAKHQRLLVDVVGSFAGVPNVWSRDSNKLLAQIERADGDSELPKLLALGAGADALAADFAVWIQPGALIDLAKATGRHEALQALAAGKSDKARRRELERQATAEIGQCERFRPIADKGPFTDVAFTVDVTPSSARGRTMWGLRKAYALAAALLVEDDGLHKWDPDSKATIVAAHYLRSLAPIRALPRPAVARGFGSLGEAMYRCGSGASFTMALLGWPALLGALLDDLRAQDPTLATIIDGARNGALVVEKIGVRDLDFVAAGAMSFDDDAAKAIAKLLQASGVASSKERIDRREVTLWPLAPLQAFRFSLQYGVVAFGGSIGKGSTKRFLQGAGASKSPPIARWRVDLGALLAQLPDTPAAGQAIADRLKPVTGELTVDGAKLIGEISVELR